MKYSDRHGQRRSRLNSLLCTLVLRAINCIGARICGAWSTAGCAEEFRLALANGGFGTRDPRRAATLTNLRSIGKIESVATRVLPPDGKTINVTKLMGENPTTVNSTMERLTPPPPRILGTRRHAWEVSSMRNARAEAISAYVATEDWQLGEIQHGIAELDSGSHVSHDKVDKWLASWGNRGEAKAP